MASVRDGTFAISRISETAVDDWKTKPSLTTKDTKEQEERIGESDPILSLMARKDGIGWEIAIHKTHVALARGQGAGFRRDSYKRHESRWKATGIQTRAARLHSGDGKWCRWSR